MIEVDMDLQTIRVVEKLPTQKWDFSVKSYGEYIWGEYNLENGETKVNTFPKIFHERSAILFTERNPAFNFKTVETYSVNTSGPEVPENAQVLVDHATDVNCGNVDPVSLKNVLRKVQLYGAEDKTAKDGATCEKHDINIEPAYVFNRVLDSENQDSYDIGKSINSKGEEITLMAETSKPTEFLLKKIASGGLFTKFNRFSLINIVPAVANQPVAQFKNAVDAIFANLSTGFSSRRCFRN